MINMGCKAASKVIVMVFYEDDLEEEDEEELIYGAGSVTCPDVPDSSVWAESFRARLDDIEVLTGAKGMKTRKALENGVKQEMENMPCSIELEHPRTWPSLRHEHECLRPSPPAGSGGQPRR